MRKDKALELLGGAHAAANAIGVTYQAINKWPDMLPGRIADRVIAAWARKYLPPEVLLELEWTQGLPASDAALEVSV